ncbi:uncharacterized protein LOC100184639 [Ciona intestinalis]
MLKTYRCARGSTSLESFHLHLNRFIPGINLSDLHFQTYLLDGISRWNSDLAAAAVSSPTTISSYNATVLHAANELKKSVFKQEMPHGAIHLGQYTGELIGVEYLFSQTGAVLNTLSDPDEPPDTLLLFDDDINLNEGFQEQEEEGDIAEATLDSLLPDTNRLSSGVSVVGPTLQASGSANISPPPDSGSTSYLSLPSTSTSASESLATDAEVCVGPCNIPGYDNVSSLAIRLVSLMECTGALTNEQALDIARLWHALDEYDKRPTVFAPRHRTTLTQGRFKAPKRKTTVTPGVESTKRCFLGAFTGPAQWPDCNRYVESTISKLVQNVDRIKLHRDGH